LDPPPPPVSPPPGPGRRPPAPGRRPRRPRAPGGPPAAPGRRGGTWGTPPRRPGPRAGAAAGPPPAPCTPPASAPRTPPAPGAPRRRGPRPPAWLSGGAGRRRVVVVVGDRTGVAPPAHGYVVVYTSQACWGDSDLRSAVGLGAPPPAPVRADGSDDRSGGARPSSSSPPSSLSHGALSGRAPGASRPPLCLHGGGENSAFDPARARPGLITKLLALAASAFRSFRISRRAETTATRSGARHRQLWSGGAGRGGGEPGPGALWRCGPASNPRPPLSNPPPPSPRPRRAPATTTEG